MPDGRLAEAVSEKDTVPFLQAAAAGLGPDQAAPVQIGACRALALLCPRVPSNALQPLLPQIYQGEHKQLLLACSSSDSGSLLC